MKNYEAMGRKFAFDTTKVTDTIKHALASAGLDTQSGPMKHVTDTIEDALSAAGLMPRSAKAQSGITIDGTAREVGPDLALDVRRLERSQASVVEPATIETPGTRQGGVPRALVYGLDGHAHVQGIRDRPATRTNRVSCFQWSSCCTVAPNRRTTSRRALE